MPSSTAEPTAEKTVGGHRLRRRLAYTLVGLSLSSVLLLGLSFLLVETYLSHTMLGDLLEREMGYLVKADVVPGPGESQGETLRYYRPARGGSPRWTFTGAGCGAPLPSPTWPRSLSPQQRSSVASSSHA